MKNYLLIMLSALVLSSMNIISAQNKDDYSAPSGRTRLMVQVHGNDTTLLAYLHEIYVFPPIKFKNKRQERYYWKTVYDVKVTLPYAKLIASELIKINQKLAKLPKNSDKKKYISEYQKQAFAKYEKNLKRMSINQGRLLLKLIDRECNKTSYDLIKSYKGNFTAFFWQGIARIFGSNLKSQFDKNGKDKVLNRIVILVENGQL